MLPPLAAALAAAALVALVAAALLLISPRSRRRSGEGDDKNNEKDSKMRVNKGGWPWWAAVPFAIAIALGAVALGVAYLLRPRPASAAFVVQAGGGAGGGIVDGPLPPGAAGGIVGGGQCAAEDAHKCGAEDPVSDPDYNMREIAKQSILLEEHLVEKNKRCKDCIAKHFMHIIALSEEAQMLAGAGIAKYPYMDDSPALYNDLFKQWLKQRTDDAVQRRIEEKLRARRKQLIETYVLAKKF